MVTTCPQCHTRFKVTQQQLQAHGGDVRCGRCALVFNAFATLAPEEAPPAAGRLAAVEAEAPSAELAAAAQEVLSEPAERETAAEEPPPPTPTEEGLHEEAFPLPPESLPAEPSLGPAPEPEEQALPPVAEPLHEPKTAERQPALARRLFWLWLVGAALLLALLAGQAVYFFRNQLATYNPQWKPVLQQFCAALSCRIGLLREADLLSIEASDLQADPARPDLIVLTATLRNRAPFPQAYPLLELTLTDARDQAAARRVFAAADYAPQADPAAGFPPKSETAVKLYISLADLKVVGYRLYLFYPAL